MSVCCLYLTVSIYRFCSVHARRTGVLSLCKEPLKPKKQLSRLPSTDTRSSAHNTQQYAVPCAVSLLPVVLFFVVRRIIVPSVPVCRASYTTFRTAIRIREPVPVLMRALSLNVFVLQFVLNVCNFCSSPTRLSTALGNCRHLC